MSQVNTFRLFRASTKNTRQTLSLETMLEKHRPTGVLAIFPLATYHAFLEKPIFTSKII